MTVTAAATISDYRQALCCDLHNTSSNRVWYPNISDATAGVDTLAIALGEIDSSFDRELAAQLVSAVAVINPNTQQHVAGDIGELAEQFAYICTDIAFHTATTHRQVVDAVTAWLRTR